jgi:anthranilate synthase component 2
MRILLIDNYDSFTYNLVHMMREHPGVSVVVKRNDQLSLNEVNDFEKIVLSPGPGLPSEAGLMPEIVRTFGASKKLFGVCLGHQCIGEIYGAKLKNLEAPVHGKATPIDLVLGSQGRSSDALFRGLPDSFEVGRYHSWVVDREEFPDDVLEVTAVDRSGEIMALRHRQHSVFGVQFHPESILTPLGVKIIQNIVEM